ncbi:MAG: gamma-glutamylcyclotransferase [Gammaproteobacteria bacterium]|nr:gamma-glutamylcyclotransferase [Gammaproteobacteria bacterium]
MEFLVFVFGTLKRNFPNSHLNQGEQLPGDFRTLKPYPLYLVGDRCSPWMVNSPDQGFQVKGELYSIDKNALRALDRLERVSEDDGYKRETIMIEEITHDQPLEAFIYLKQSYDLDTKQIKLGPIPEYTLEMASIYKQRPGSSDIVTE